MAFRAASLLPAIVVLLMSLGGSRLGVRARGPHRYAIPSPKSPGFIRGYPEQVYRARIGDRLDKVFVFSLLFNHRVACAVTHVATGRIKQCRVGFERPYKTGRRYIFDPLRREDLGVYQAHTVARRQGDPTWNITFTIAEQGSLFVEGSPKQAYVGELGAPFSFSCASQPYLLQPAACSALHVGTNRTIPCRYPDGNSSERTFVFPKLSVEHSGTYVCQIGYETGLTFNKSFTITGELRAAPRQAIVDLALPSPYAIVRNWGSDVFVFLHLVPAGRSSLGSMVCRGRPQLTPKASEIAWKVTSQSTAEHGAGKPIQGYRITKQADPMRANMQLNTTGMAPGQEFICSVRNNKGRAKSTVTFYQQGNMSARVLAFFKTTSTGNTTTTYTLKVALSGLPMGTHKYCVNLPTALKYCSGWTFPRTEVQNQERSGNFTLGYSWIPALKPNCEGLATWVLTVPTALARAVKHRARVKLILSGLQQEQADSTRTRRMSKIYRFGKLQERGHEDVALSHTLRCL